MKISDNQPIRNKRRIRLMISYIFLTVWITGILFLYHNPFIIWWIIYSGFAAILLIVSLYISSFKKMFLEEKVVIFFLLSPIILIILICILTIVLGQIGKMQHAF